MPLWLGESMISLALMITAAVFYLVSKSFPQALNPADVGPSAFPRLMAGITFLLGLAQFLFSLLTRPKDWVAVEDKSTFLLGLILTILYLYLFPKVGYFYATPVFIALLMFILGNKSWLQILATIVGFVLFAYYVFFKLLQVSLPV